MNNKIGNRTYNALQNLYLNSKEIQDIIEDKINPLSYAKEFGTIKVTSSRRAGHTTAIGKFLAKYGKGNWVIITHNQNMSEYVKNMTKCAMGKILINKITLSAIEHSKGLVSFITKNQIDNALRGIEIDGIIVDGASLLSQSAIENIYKVGSACMTYKKYQFFIFME